MIAREQIATSVRVKAAKSESESDIAPMAKCWGCGGGWKGVSLVVVCSRDAGLRPSDLINRLALSD